MSSPRLATRCRRRNPFRAFEETQRHDNDSTRLHQALARAEYRRPHRGRAAGAGRQGRGGPGIGGGAQARAPPKSLRLV